MKPKLVEDWKQCWRWLSVNCMVLAGAVQGAWIYIPEDLRRSMPENLVTGITMGLLVLGVMGRLVKQGKRRV